MQCVKHLFKKGTPFSIRRGILLAIDFLAVGRSGEAGLQSLSNCHWDEGNQFLVINWPQMKTAQQKLLTMHHDSQEPFMENNF